MQTQRRRIIHTRSPWSGLLQWTLSVLALLATSTAAHATNGYQFIGVGQCAMGMAGAVVAAPCDPMTAISNPAGLAWLASQTAFSGEIFNPLRSANFGFGNVGSNTNVYVAPALGWSAPAFKPNIYFGGGIYGTSGMGVNYLQPNTPMGTIQAYSSLNFMQMAPAVAFKFDDKLAVGLALDGGAEQISFNQTFGGQGFNLSSPSWAYGVGATVGVLYKRNSKVTLGASYKSEMLFTRVYWNETSEFIPTGVQVTSQGMQPVGVQGGPGTYSARLNYPQQLAFGAAFHPTTKLLISTEGQWINWHKTMNDFNVHGPWTGTSFVSLPLHWQNEWVGNIGAQYDTGKSMQWRGGFVYGGNPIKSADMQANLIMPAIVTTGMTFGATQKLPMRWSLTEALMHMFQNSVTDGTLFNLPLQPVKSSMSENSIGFQIGYFF
ncbi:MAG: outer membrane protein transport protein [Acidobacteriota bacterium]|nr:outer membrane protein transport protein [Acidobacteriota bacterium]